MGTGHLFQQAVDMAVSDNEKIIQDFIASKGGIDQAITAIAYDKRDNNEPDIAAVFDTLLGLLIARRDPSLSKPPRRAFVCANNGRQLAIFIQNHPFSRENLPRAIDAARLLRSHAKAIVYLLPGWDERALDHDELRHTAMGMEHEIVMVSEEMLFGDKRLPVLPI